MLERALHRAISVLVIAAGATLLYAQSGWGYGEPVYALLTLGALVLGLRRARQRRTPVLGALSGTLLTLVALALIAFRAIELLNALVPAGDLLFVLIAVKLLQKKGSRDYVQILVLTFGQVLIAAVLTQEPAFAVGFVIYFAALVWTLMLFHFQREQSGDFAPPGAPRPPVGCAEPVLTTPWRLGGRTRGSGLYVQAAFVCVLALLITTAVFIGMPRLSSGFLGPMLPPLSGAQSGFSEQVTLGGSGAITPSAAVALYVAYDREPVPRRPLYRGAVQDLFDPERSTWLTIPLGPREVTRRRRLRAFGPRLTRRVPGVYVGREFNRRSDEVPTKRRQDVPISVRILDVRTPRRSQFCFSPGFVTRFRFVNYTGPGLLRRGHETIRTARREEGELTYQVDALPSVRDTPAFEQQARAPTWPSTQGPRGPWPLAPDPAQDQRVRERLQRFAAQHAPGTTWTPTRVAQLERTLSAPPYRYTLDLATPPEGVTAVEHFLFTRKAGHCEDYASALALILRANGVSARLVTGYAGGMQVDRIGDALVDVVRQGQAHAWCEVYFGPRWGWVPYDPSPQIGDALDPPGWFGRLLAQLKYHWGQDVVGFDFAAQLSLLRGIKEQLSQAFRRISRFATTLADEVLGPLAQDASGTFKRAFGLALLGVPLAIVGVWWWRRRRRRYGAAARAPGPPPRFVPLERCLRELARLKLVRKRGETPAEFLQRPGVTIVLASGDRQQLLDAFHTVRYGARPAPIPQQALAAIVARLRAAVRDRAKARAKRPTKRR